jgi:hypothetical protein
VALPLVDRDGASCQRFRVLGQFSPAWFDFGSGTRVAMHQRHGTRNGGRPSPLQDAYHQIGQTDGAIRRLDWLGRAAMQLAQHILMFPALVIGVMLIPAHAQSSAAGMAPGAVRAQRTAHLSVDALCARLPLEEVSAIMGAHYVRMPEKDKLYRACTYGDSKEDGKLQVRYFSLGNSSLQEAGWRKFVEAESKGKVIERDGVLVSRIRRNKFGTDSIWFKDRQGHVLELNVNAGVTEDQAVALAKAAMD